ncbi:MAG: SDR family oxidoreductase, partial [Atopostipes suicloacalis]|nr:SDR family oxidoreductase [Atopostipes suicloacalis]
LTRSLAVEWADKNVRVNAVSPGYIGTELITESKELEPLIEQWTEVTPQKRMGDPDELQGIYLYLASEASSYTTGSDFIVDGGYTAI